MQRLFSFKEATKLLKHHQKSNPNHILYKPNNQPFSHFTTTSSSDIASGFLSKPGILNPIARFSRLVEGFGNSRVGFLKNQIFKRYSGYGSSFQAQRRGWESWLRRQSPDHVVLGMIVTYVAVFMMWRIASSIYDEEFHCKWHLNTQVSLENFKSGRGHTMITSAFSQIDVGHLMSNMIGLYFFGSSIGRQFGSAFLLKLYLAGAFAGSVLFLAHKGLLALNSKIHGGWGLNPSRIPGLGASGAVNAIMLLDIFLNPNATLYLEFIIPVPAISLGIFLIGKDMMRIFEGDSQVSGSAHLGGAVIAALAWLRIRKTVLTLTGYR